MKSKIVHLLLIILLSWPSLAFSASESFTATSSSGQSVKFDFSFKNSEEVVEDEYIVVLNDNENAEIATKEIVSEESIELNQEFTELKSFSATISEEKLNEVLEDPKVKFVSRNRVVKTTASKPKVIPQTIPTGRDRVDADQTGNKGSGIGVAVLDTGIDLDHPDLAANIIANKNCVKPTKNGDDDNGHGSHVAGTIAALDNLIGSVGVAPEAKLVAVKVLSGSGSGTWSNIICGIDWVITNSSAYNIKVINLSLGGSGTSDNNCGNSNRDALHQAICRARDAGITVVVAAGNDGKDASKFVPAAYDDAVIAVSALVDTDGKPGGLGKKTSKGADDTFAKFSNYGSPIDIAAPGVEIYSTDENGKYDTMSGTSMATPHVSAAAALYIKSHPGSSWSDVKNGLISQAEGIGSGHTDPSNKHPEPLIKVNGL